MIVNTKYISYYVEINISHNPDETLTVEAKLLLTNFLFWTNI